jgi:predicted AlkP superfamily pyrophosphatase or phosphodiesterase
VHKLLTFFSIALISALEVFPQRIKNIPPAKPVLVVAIVVEQMRADYITRFWDDYGSKGFRRMYTNGTVCANTSVGYSSAQASAGYATISTGSFPSQHGIVADRWYDRVSSQRVTSVHDAKVKPIGGRPGHNEFSPHRLGAPSWADELGLFYGKASKSVSVSLNAAGAVLMGGFSPAGAYWFCAETGNWSTSSFYSQFLPGWAAEFNAKKIPDLYMAADWNPSKLITEYHGSQPDKSRFETGYAGRNVFPYKHLSVAPRGQKYTSITMMPSGNTLVKDFAIQAIAGEALGTDSVPDFLSVSFSAQAQVGAAFGIESIELRDIYIKLDAEIGFLLDFLESKYGMSNVLVFLTSTSGMANTGEYLESLNMPSGQFRHRQAAALLESYLSAIYGQGQWVSHYENGQIYLNHILIENARLDIETVRSMAAQFIIQINGVAQAYTAGQLHTGCMGGKLFQRVANSYNMQRSGDISIVLQPGWTEQLLDSPCLHCNPYSASNDIPLIWYGWKAEKKKVYTSISLADIAPTLSAMLSMPKPQGASGSVVPEVLPKQ